MYTNQIVCNTSHVLEIQSLDYSAFKWDQSSPLFSPHYTTTTVSCSSDARLHSALGFYFDFCWEAREHQSAEAETLLGYQKHRSSLCISSRISIDGTVHQDDFDSHAWFVAMTLPDHFPSHGCCCNSPLSPLLTSTFSICGQDHSCGLRNSPIWLRGFFFFLEVGGTGYPMW